ncbi:hypothetical protein RPQ02_16990 [Streptomyces sp. AM2-3-1]|uniref:hypothetical protein n=1 Tax=Streptomyces sp. AM2-3-1 TaxID=3075824 RepID=UPI0028C3F016|nr:hypothetical protein [Streptomyces sp. AM2-3-1]WNO65376.1 hypothetical protein RPQ02_16990 [Streptomyces sp. AM2-3-1]
MSRWYQPHEQWPGHPKAWWRETIALARSAGWHLQRIEGHSWGRIVCDPRADKPCKVLIFSTGVNGESAALTARKKVERCDHLTASDADQLLFRAAGLLDRAEALLEAASRCLEAADKRTEAEELLLGAATAADEAEKLTEALAREADGDRLVVEAFAVLPQGAELGCPPTPAELDVLIVDASAQVDEAEQLADGLPAGDPADGLRGRIQQVRAQVAGLDVRLRRGRDANGSHPA